MKNVVEIATSTMLFCRSNRTANTKVESVSRYLGWYFRYTCLDQNTSAEIPTGPKTALPRWPWA